MKKYSRKLILMKINRRFPNLNFFNENYFQKLTVEIKKMSASLFENRSMGERRKVTFILFLIHDQS